MFAKHIAWIGFTVAAVLVLCVCYVHLDEVSRILIVPTSRELPTPMDKLRPTSHSMAALLMDTSEDETSSAQSEIHVYEGAGKLSEHANSSSEAEGNVHRGNKVDVYTSLTESEQLSVSELPSASNASIGKGSSTHCQPATHLVFLKMHKCSSSTVQNILFRYGEEHGLDFVLPPQGNYLGHSAFQRQYMMDFPVKEYNILCHHTVFNAKAMAEVMPSDSVYVTILRDPVPMFESIFTYNTMAKIYRLPESRALELFLKKPEYYYGKQDGGILHLRNPMLYGLGLPKGRLGNQAAIDGIIADAQRQFDLVMMTEYFEESLVLLKHLMCWATDDVVYFVVNARSKTAVRPLSPQTAAQIRRWNRGDVKLYQAFNRTFWQKVQAFGVDRMKREVAELHERNQYYKQHCISRVINDNAKVWHPPGVPIDSFKVKPEAMGDTMCVRMAEPELSYTKHLQDIQLKRYRMG